MVERTNHAGAVEPIEILLMGPGLDEDFEDVARELSHQIDCPVVIRRSTYDPSRLIDEKRGQIHAARLMSTLEERGDRDAVLLRLGVVAPDLYRDGVTFEFGEALRDGPFGVLSLHRLREENYCLPPSPEILRRRVLTESLHELGHMFGLDHCASPGCAMGFSFDVQDVDAKAPELCPKCHALMRRGVRRLRARRRPAPPSMRGRRIGMTTVFVALLLGWVFLPWGPSPATATPIHFSHSRHLGDAGLDCVDCHVDASCGKWSGLPGPVTCARCHARGIADAPDLVPLQDWIDDGGSPPWCPGEICPSRSTEFHEREVHRGGTACRCCHGGDSRCTASAECREGPNTCSTCHDSAEIRSTCRSCHP